MTIIALRDYQQEALNAVIKAFQEGVHRQLIVLPTASGKTFIMAAIAKHYNLKVLLIAHREELIQQAKNKIKEFWPEADIGICKAKRKEFNHQIVIGSTQTCCRSSCLKQLKEKNFDILMVDETHHAPAKTYQRIIDTMGFSAQTQKLLIGVTATPMRSDRKQLGDFFDKVVYSKTAGELINSGYLSPVFGRRILTSFNLNSVHTRMGDFAVNELASVVNTKERNQFVVEKFKKYSTDRKAIVFCVDVQHCHDLAQIFNDQGIKSKAIWGEMKPVQRKRILSSFSKGNIQIVTSCGVLTEGFDEPSIQAIVMARPTKSKGLYIQMAGRGLRKHPEKENCLVLDFTDQYHNLDTVITLNRAIPGARQLEEEKPKVKCEEMSHLPRINTLKDIDREFDILGAQSNEHLNFIWLNIGDNEFSLTDDNNNEIVIQPIDRGFIATAFYKNGDVENIILQPEAFDRCIEISENFARKHLTITFADLRNPWLESAKRQKPTLPQVGILKQHNCFNSHLNKTEAALKISKILALQRKGLRRYSNHITPKQKSILERSGFKVDNISKHEAYVMIAKLKRGESYEYR